MIFDYFCQITVWISFPRGQIKHIQKLLQSSKWIFHWLRYLHYLAVAWAKYLFLKWSGHMIWTEYETKWSNIWVISPNYRLRSEFQSRMCSFTYIQLLPNRKYFASWTNYFFNCHLKFDRIGFREIIEFFIKLVNIDCTWVVTGGKSSATQTPKSMQSKRLRTAYPPPILIHYKFRAAMFLVEWLDSIAQTLRFSLF